MVSEKTEERRSASSAVNRSKRRFSKLVGAAPLWLSGMSAAVSGCATEADSKNNELAETDPYYILKTNIVSRNQDSRVRELVLHYTAEPIEKTLEIFADPEYKASAHYLVCQSRLPGGRVNIYELVKEEYRAWHAGVSYWQGNRLLNSSSIGVEIVNRGFPQADGGKLVAERRWYPYPMYQIEAVAELAAEIIERHKIAPEKIVGHSDIAPGRKWDPGPLFPWRLLFERYGIGAWPEAHAVDYFMSTEPFDGEVAALQAKLEQYGYDTPRTGMLDTETRDVITAFQTHFRPERIDGMPDIDTVARLDALIAQYRM